MSPAQENEVPTEQLGAPGEAVNLLRRKRRLTLVAYHRGGVEAAPLRTDLPVIVGRCPPADLCVPSPALSRTHARFTLGAEGRVAVEDLESTNGTWIDGARIRRADIDPGTEVIIGDALVSVQSVAPVEVAIAGTSRAEAGGSDAPIAVAPAMCALFATAARVAESRVPVILHGETGTGKEVVARFLHERGPRARKPMVCVNCAAIPAQLVESTLFGYEKGAFTGAGQRQKGLFEEADGGTVFLDEIGELPLPAQAALLRVLETGRFARVGSPREIAVDVRVVAASHRDLEALRDGGTFRADLYYRLGVMVLSIPALRDRVEDIGPLARRFLANAGGAAALALSPGALARLEAYAWPGNVRELCNTLERAALFARDGVVRDEDLPPRVRGATHAPESLARLQMPTLVPPADTPSPVPDLRAHMQQYELRRILEALESAGWNQSEAARQLGMPIRTLSYKIKAFGLRKPAR